MNARLLPVGGLAAAGGLGEEAFPPHWWTLSTFTTYNQMNTRVVP